MEHIKIIVNPKAGNDKGRIVGLKFEDFLLKRGIQYSIDYTFKSKAAISLAKKAATNGYSLIVGIGGDGTINEIANGIAESSSTLAVIPAGKHNNFAKMLNLSMDDLQSCFETTLNGRTILSDMGKIDDTYFINGVSIGLGAEVIDNINQKNLGSDKFNYLLNLFKKGATYTPQKIKVHFNQLSIISNSLMAKIQNGKFFGGGFYFSKNASITDGNFDVVVYNSAGKINFLTNTIKFINGKHNNSFPISVFKTNKIRIEAENNAKILCDGEILYKKMPLEICIAEKKIKIKAR